MVARDPSEDGNNNHGHGRERRVSFQGDEKSKKDEELDTILNTKKGDGESGAIQSLLTKPEPFEPDLRPPSEPEPESPATGATSRLARFPAEGARGAAQEEGEGREGREPHYQRISTTRAGNGILT